MVSADFHKLHKLHKLQITKILLAVPAAHCSIGGPCHMISDYKGTFDFRFFTARGTISTIDLSDNHKNESNSGTECTLRFY